jgi:hypothetical protein
MAIVSLFMISPGTLSSGGDAMSCNASSETMIRTFFPRSSCILMAQPNMFTDRIGSVLVPLRAIATLSRAKIISAMLSEVSGGGR